jgi:DNA-binding Lrp family transcriptional regulator
MPPPCKLCAAPERLDYEKKLATGLLTEVDAARMLNISQQAVSRHMRNHLAPRLEKRIAAKLEKEDDSIVAALKKSRAKILAICDAALADGDYNAAIRALSTEIQSLALEGKVTNAYTDAPTIQVAFVENPEFHELQQQLVEALAPYPDACEAVGRVFIEKRRKSLP